MSTEYQTIWRQGTAGVETLYEEIRMPRRGLLTGVAMHAYVNTALSTNVGVWLQASTLRQAGPFNGVNGTLAFMILNATVLTAVGAFETSKNEFFPVHYEFQKNEVLTWGRANGPEGAIAAYIGLYVTFKD